MSLVVPMLPTLLSAGFASLRVIYPIASIAAVLVMNAHINLLSKGECTESNSPTPIKLMHCMILLLIALQCVSFNKIYINRFQVNFADKETAKYIQEEISQYEKETGNTVTKIAIYCDSDSWYYNEDLSIDYGSQEISSRYYEIKSEVIRDSIYNSYWAAIPGINYYLGTNYERAEQSEYYTEYFSQFDWTRLSSKQLVFDGDTLHLCVY